MIIFVLNVSFNRLSVFIIRETNGLTSLWSIEALQWIAAVFYCSVGYFIDPTVIETKDPKNKWMLEVTEYIYVVA